MDALQKSAGHVADNLPKDCTAQFALLAGMHSAHVAINALHAVESAILAELETPSVEMVESVAESFAGFNSDALAALQAAAAHIKAR